jgi:hypothetical protein
MINTFIIDTKEEEQYVDESLYNILSKHKPNIFYLLKFEDSDILPNKRKRTYKTIYKKRLGENIYNQEGIEIQYDKTTFGLNEYILKIIK